MKKKGYLSLVLHAHLPYVRHPEHEHFLEEDWLYEAITETYLPLLNVFESLLTDRISFRITMSMTPPLVSMLRDELLIGRYVRHLENLIELSEKEVFRTRSSPEFNKLARFYRERFKKVHEQFTRRYRCNILSAFKRVSDTGSLEIVTCCATHGFLPLMQVNPRAVRAQIRVAVNTHRRVFGKKPGGIWLAECGYYPGLEEILEEEGIRYFFVDTHALLYGSPRPRYGAFAPVYTPAGPAAFARDIESSRSVWSAEEGYPGDYQYREFYRDIGFDLDEDYIAPYLHTEGFRKNTGIKYYRITGKSREKEAYNPFLAARKAEEHAANFLYNREKQVEHLYGIMGGRKPLVVSPYDAELYGHWWYEGPGWLNHVLRKTAQTSGVVSLTHPPEYLRKRIQCQVQEPVFSSWGYKGYAEVWLNNSNDWVYRHLHEAADRMVSLAEKYNAPTKHQRKALNQAARELLLAQSSDWAFIMKTGTMVEYATKRTRDHILNFLLIEEELGKKRLDKDWLNTLCSRNNIFPDIDYRVYR